MRRDSGSGDAPEGGGVRWLIVLAAAALLGAGVPAVAQTASRPGPWALDVRGVTSPVPEEPAFYPPLDRTALVPSRGFGLDVGAHVYLFDLGASRLGVGVDVVNVRALTEPPTPVTAPGAPPAPARQSVQVDLRMVAPQVSFNFGSRDGWSYLSAGAGFADVVSRTAAVLPGRSDSGRLNALNVGGGARWFFKSRLAFGFDVRLHKIDAGPGGTVELTGSGAGSGTGTGNGTGSGSGTGTGTTAPPTPIPVPQPTPGKMILAVGVGFSIR